MDIRVSVFMDALGLWTNMWTTNACEDIKELHLLLEQRAEPRAHKLSVHCARSGTLSLWAVEFLSSAIATLYTLVIYYMPRVHVGSNTSHGVEENEDRNALMAEKLCWWM